MRIKTTLDRRIAVHMSFILLVSVASFFCFNVTSHGRVVASRPPTHAPRASASQDGIESLRMVILPKPDFRRASSARTTGGGTRLVISSSRANQITDDAEWFERNGLRLPLYELGDTPDSAPSSANTRLPSNVPVNYKGHILTKAIAQSASTLLVYGRNYGEGRYLVSMNPVSGAFRYGFDFGNYVYPPDIPHGERSFVYQNIDWAVEEGDVLYVAHSHATYARSSRGMNAYLTAINIRDARVIWRSQPLVSNASNFEVVGDLIVSGYGFTNEPDFLYLIDKRTGTVVHRLAVKSGPTYIIRKGDKIYVRAYNADFVVSLVSGARRRSAPARRS
ncbi:MAG TPA: hypothetical protein VF666_18750 [Pyrinomonadaceae bacterium]|jgi:hypothetical protein